jgi:uncharacterized protein
MIPKKSRGGEKTMVNIVTTKEEIINRIVNERDKLASFGVVSIGLFGSFVRGEQTPSSDIDILIEFEREKHTFDNFMEVSFLLEDLLGRKVEVVTPEGLSPHIGPHILKEVEHVPFAA